MKKWKGLVLLLGLISACSVGIAPKQKVKEETFSLAISYGVTKDVWPSFNSFYNVTNVIVSTIEDGTLFWRPMRDCGFLWRVPFLCSLWKRMPLF